MEHIKDGDYKATIAVGCDGDVLVIKWHCGSNDMPEDDLSKECCGVPPGVYEATAKIADVNWYDPDDPDAHDEEPTYCVRWEIEGVDWN